MKKSSRTKGMSNEQIKTAKEYVSWGRIGMGMKTTTYSKGQDCPQVRSLLIVSCLPLVLLVYQSFLVYYFQLHIFLYHLHHTYQHLQISFRKHTLRSTPNIPTFGLLSPPDHCAHIYGPHFSPMFNVSYKTVAAL